MDVGGWGGGPYAKFQFCVISMLMPGFPGRQAGNPISFCMGLQNGLLYFISPLFINMKRIINDYFLCLFLPGKD